MPRGSGIYEDQPREHRTSYTQHAEDRPEDSRAAATPDDTSSDEAAEPTG
ncbi:hypothetical protein H7K45_07280 [Mycobacterium yunnanensis]|uniref:Uncharacterized protein n=1 Tax=Mycobacterium yunnanensis TaxID=368477 RepID=A0A9X3C2H8_9MYCO|nr:hypothetical protein [Mycobacterium yunnanensis]MCV7420337.1 hypothetical protein [Mycobacterium yunnanensis]